MRYARSGRAKINIRHPQAMGESDLSGFWYPLASMRHKMEWSGNSLVDTGLLVGPDELDMPQQQYRSVIMPPDPRPVPNPRPSPNVTGYGPVYATVGRPFGTGEYGTDGYGMGRLENKTGPTTPGNWGLTQLIVGGASVAPFVPLTKADVLNRVKEITGINLPNQLFDRSVRITTANKSYPLMGTQPGRGWFLIYNPANPQTQVALTAGAPAVPVGSIKVTWGNITNLILGPGEAYFCSVQQGLGPCYQGALAVVGLIGDPDVPPNHPTRYGTRRFGRFRYGTQSTNTSKGLEFWAWEAAFPYLWLTDDYGELITDEWGQAIQVEGWGSPTAYFENIQQILHVHEALAWPTEPKLKAAVWNNNGIASVGPGAIQNVNPDPVFFGQITPLELQTIGGGDLPWIRPLRKNQLWNPGGGKGGPIKVDTGNLPRGYGTGGYGTFAYGTRPPTWIWEIRPHV